jgi:AcrR family transcriptional regulator
MKETKEYILDVAQDLFLKKGYKAVTMKELVETSGFTKGAIYHYFESKEALFREVVERFSPIAAMHTEPNTEGLSLRQFYRAYAKQLASKMLPKDSRQVAGQNSLRLVMDALSLFPDFGETILIADRNQNDCWIKVIQEAKDSGEINSTMSNEYIAKMFRYSADGAGMYMILFDTGNLEDNLIALYDDFYRSLTP